MLVARSAIKEDKILEISKLRKVQSLFYSRLDHQICKYLLPMSKEWKTSGLFGVVSARYLNQLSNFDVINIHWIGHGLISLNQLAKVKKKVIWTLHDEWVIGGITHYGERFEINKSTLRTKILRFLLTYTEQKRLQLFNNLNLQLVPVSSDIKNKLLVKYPHLEARIKVIPNALDTSVFYPLAQIKADLPTVLFLGGTSDPRKGWDLLRESCFHARLKYKLLLVGSSLQEKIGNVQISGISRITSIYLLQQTISNAIVLVVPSRAEALPQVATEAISCGTPVVAFGVGGLTDIIKENVTGKIVKPFDTKEFAHAIDKVLMQGKSFYSDKCRLFAIKTFSFESVALQYQNLL